MTRNLFHRPQSIRNKLNVKSKTFQIKGNQQPVKESDSQQQTKCSKYLVIFHWWIAPIFEKDSKGDVPINLYDIWINKMFNSNHAQSNLQIYEKRERYNQRPDISSSKVFTSFSYSSFVWLS